MSKHVLGFGASKLLLVGALTVFSVTAPGAASAVTLASYSSFASSSLLLTGVRALDGEPVGTDAIRRDVDVFGGDNFVDIYVTDADGNEISPDGIAEADVFEGRLFDAGFDVSAFSTLFAYGEIYAFENVSGDPLLASFRVDRRAEAEAVSMVDTATSRAGADNEGAGLYFETADGDFLDDGDRLSLEAIDALSSGFSVGAASDGETRVSASVLHDFEVLLDAGDTFNADFFFVSTFGSLSNTPVAPVPLPAGAPLLLAALGGLAALRWRRNLARQNFYRSFPAFWIRSACGPSGRARVFVEDRPRGGYQGASRTVRVPGSRPWTSFHSRSRT